jgi:hypothetical protein
MTDTISHGYTMYLLMLIKLFYCALKCDFISKPVQTFLELFFYLDFLAFTSSSVSLLRTNKLLCFYGMQPKPEADGHHSI